MGEGILIIPDSPREKEEAKLQRFTNWKNLFSAGQMHSPSRPRGRNELKRRYFHRGNLWPWTLVILVAVLLRFMMFYDISFPFQSSTSSIPVARPKDVAELYRRARDRLGNNPAARVIRPEKDAWIAHNFDAKGTMTKTEIETFKGSDESLTLTPNGPDLKDGNVLAPQDNEVVNKVGGVAESQLSEIGQRIKAVKEFHGQTDDVLEMREIRTLKNGKDQGEAEGREGADDDQRQIDTLGQVLDKKKTAEVGEVEMGRKDSDTSEERDAGEQMTVSVNKEAKDERTAEETEAEDKRVVRELGTPKEREEAAKERKVAKQIEIDEERKADEVMMATKESEADEQGRAGQEREAAEEQKSAQKGESDDGKEPTEEREASQGKKAEEEESKADEQVEVREKKGEEDKSAADKTEADVQTNDEGRKQSQHRDVEEKNLNEEEQKIANDQEKDVGVLKLDQSTEESKHIEDKNPVEENEKDEEKHEDSDPKYEQSGTSHNDRTGAESHAGHCDLFEGDWEWEPEGPLYTNATCFYMQGTQNCMSNGRPDTAYLHWKWKPRDCDLPRFDARAFLEAFKGKTIGFVGDSLARNQMQSLLCMLSQIEVPRMVYQSQDDATVRWLYEQHQVTLAVLWSPYLLKESSEGIMGFEKGQSVLYLDVLDAEWTSVMHDFDIIVLSIGQWYFKGSIYVRQDEVVGCHYCPGFNFTEMTYQEAFQGALRQVLGKVASEFKGIAIMSTFAISHFEDGPWQNGGQCRREQPLSKEEGEKFPGLHSEMHDIVMSEYNSIAYDKSKLNGEVKLDFLDVTKVSLTRADGHPGPYRRANPYEGKGPDEWVPNDCLHWCLPGPVDTWNQLLVKLVHRHLGSSS